MAVVVGAGVLMVNAVPCYGGAAYAAASFTPDGEGAVAHAVATHFAKLVAVVSLRLLGCWDGHSSRGSTAATTVSCSSFSRHSLLRFRTEHVTGGFMVKAHPHIAFLCRWLTSQAAGSVMFKASRSFVKSAGFCRM